MRLFSTNHHITNHETLNSWIEYNKFVFDEGTIWSLNHKDYIGIYTKVSDTDFSLCYVDGLQGQCGAATLYGWSKGTLSIGKHILQVEKFLNACNYTKMLITITQGMELMQQCGFKEIDSFRNKRTGNVVKVLMRDIE
jgi:hypothetical protein